jgi:hypothetical protein
MRRDPPPAEFGALISGNPPPSPRKEQHVAGPQPTAPPRELVELRQMLEQTLGERSSSTDRRTPFARPRAPGHETWCVCHECTAAPPEPPVSIH